MRKAITNYLLITLTLPYWMWVIWREATDCRFMLRLPNPRRHDNGSRQTNDRHPERHAKR